MVDTGVLRRQALAAKGDDKGKGKGKGKGKHNGKCKNGDTNEQRSGTPPGPKLPNYCNTYYSGHCKWGQGCLERHMHQKDLEKWQADNKAAV